MSLNVRSVTWSSCRSLQTNTFQHISSVVQLQKCTPLHECRWIYVTLTLDSKTGFNSFKNNTDNFLLNHVRARFYRILCISARRPVVLTAAYIEMFTTVMVQWHCHVVSRYRCPPTPAQYVAMRTRHCCVSVKAIRSDACVRFQIMTFTILFPRTYHRYTFVAVKRPSLL